MLNLKHTEHANKADKALALSVRCPDCLYLDHVEQPSQDWLFAMRSMHKLAESRCGTELLGSSDVVDCHCGMMEGQLISLDSRVVTCQRRHRLQGVVHPGLFECGGARWDACGKVEMEMERT